MESESNGETWKAKFASGKTNESKHEFKSESEK